MRRQTRAAENAYRTQGVAIQRAANQQRRRRRRTAGPPSPRPRPPQRRPSGPGAFEPFRAKHGIARQQQRARRRTRRAANRLPDNRYVPHIPVISTGYTPRQRTVIRQTLRRAAKRGGYRSLEELYRAASPRQRQQIRRVGRIVTYGPEVARDPQALVGLREHNLRDTVAPRERYPLGHKALQAAGLVLDPTHSKLLRAGGATAYNVGRAFYEAPIQTSKTSVRSARESVTGIPQGILDIAHDPVKGIEAIVKDYEDRYGSALNNPKKFRARVKSEWGLTPYVLDAAAAASGVGQIAGRAVTTTRFGRAAAALERSRVPGARIARVAHETMASERPALRFSGGEKGARPQTRSRNLFVGLGQRRLDISREKAHGKRLQQGQARALDREVGAGEVTPKTNGLIGRSLREYGRTNRRYTGRIARDIGGGTSKGRLRLLTARADVVGKRAAPILRDLNERERLAVREMAELGVRSGPDGIRALAKRLKKLERNGHGENTDAVAIRQILADPERHLTARAGEAMDAIHDIQLERAALDPELPEATEVVRRLAAQAQHLGLKQGPNVERFLSDVRKIEKKTGATGLADLARDVARASPEDRPALAKKLARRIEVQANAARRDVVTAQGRAKMAQTAVKATGRITTPEVRAARQELARATMARETATTPTARVDARERVRTARQAVREAEANAPVGTEAQRARAVHHEHVVAARAETRDYVEKTEKAVRKIHKKVKSQAAKQANRATFDPRLLEGHREFAARVRAAADESGLAEPVYWKGVLEGDLKPAPRLAAAGTGLRATERPRRSKGVLTAQGRGERDPEVLLRGLETNLKRQFQYELVQKNVETHAFPWSRNNGKGMTIDQIKMYARDHGIDPDSITIADTRIITREANADVPADLVDDLSTTVHGELHEAIPSGRFGIRSQTLGKIVSRPYSHLAQNRYLAMPAEVGEAIDGVANALDSPFMRGTEVVLKQIPSRLLLGLSPPWLMFQVAGNAIFTGLAGTNPLDLAGGVRFARALERSDPEAHAAWEAANGITHGHNAAFDTMSLGETNSHFVAYMRAMKATRLGSLIHRKNPFDILFKADVGQTNFWRKAVWYSKARRLSYRRMNYNMDRSYKLIDRLSAGLLTKGPERFAQEYAKAGPELEQAAKHVSAFLGDYVNYTPSERLFLSRHLMFYGWLRHSLRFMFHTMPVGHPIMTAILGDIGRLGANEIKDLLGVPRTHGLPMSVSSLLYLGDRHDAKTGNLRTLPVNRLNPFLNAISQLDNNQQVLGMVSPAVQMTADQFFEESSFTGKDWRVRGQYTPAESERESSYYNKGPARERILLRQALNLAFPYRVWERAVLEPSQSDDALAWSPRPLHPKEEEARQGIAKARRQFRREGPLTAIRNEVFPFPLPGAGLGAKRTAAPEFLKRELEKEADAANRARGRRKTRRRKTSSSQYGGGQYGGGQYGGGQYGGSQYGGG